MVVMSFLEYLRTEDPSAIKLPTAPQTENPEVLSICLKRLAGLENDFCYVRRSALSNDVLDRLDDKFGLMAR